MRMAHIVRLGGRAIFGIHFSWLWPVLKNPLRQEKRNLVRADVRPAPPTATNNKQ